MDDLILGNSNEVGAWNEDALYKYNKHDEIKKNFSNIIKVNIVLNDHGKHIAQKPLNLMEFLISLVTVEGQVILDPFMGSGTTCLAAKRLNRHFIGIDIDENNILIAKKRISTISQVKIEL